MCPAEISTKASIVPNSSQSVSRSDVKSQGRKCCVLTSRTEALVFFLLRCSSLIGAVQHTLTESQIPVVFGAVLLEVFPGHIFGGALLELYVPEGALFCCALGRGFNGGLSQSSTQRYKWSCIRRQRETLTSQINQHLLFLLVSSSPSGSARKSDV